MPQRNVSGSKITERSQQRSGREEMSSLNLFEAVARFGGESAPSSEEIMSLTSLQFPSDLSQSEDRQEEVKVELRFKRTNSLFNL
jgi:hypothetical protein